jgi:hypothetical protein
VSDFDSPFVAKFYLDGFGEIHTNDRQMIGAAGHFGLVPREV